MRRRHILCQSHSVGLLVVRNMLSQHKLLTVGNWLALDQLGCVQHRIVVSMDGLLVIRLRL